jgi:hypothetical protein
MKGATGRMRPCSSLNVTGRFSSRAVMRPVLSSTISVAADSIRL